MIRIISDSDRLDQVDDYSHTISTSIGFDSASFSVTVPINDAEHWLSEKIGRKVTAYNDIGEVIWEGFINEILASVGGMSVNTGPLTEVVNKVRVAYQTIDYSIVYVPSEGRKTEWAYDYASLTKYFTMELEVSGGTAYDEDAEAYRDMYLQEHASPATSEEVSLTPGGDAYRVQVSCLGYGHLLDHYYVENFDGSDVTVTQKVLTILGYDPNGFSDTARYGRIDTISTLIPAWEEGDRTGLAAINEAISVGDSALNRVIFGVYEDMTVALFSASSEPAYNISLASTGHQVRHAQGNVLVAPELVRPGFTGVVTDFFSGSWAPGEWGSLDDPPHHVYRAGFL
jgi:hypothetical protein